MGQWLPDSLEEPYNEHIASRADHYAGSVDESIGRQFDDEEGGGFADAVVGDSRDDFVLRPGTTERSAYDWIMDYEGEWGGQEDQHDITGPSLDPRGLDTGNDTSLVDWRSDQSQENDPTSPENMPVSYTRIIQFMLVMMALYLLKPVLEMMANATEAA